MPEHRVFVWEFQNKKLLKLHWIELDLRTELQMFSFDLLICRFLLLLFQLDIFQHLFIQYGLRVSFTFLKFDFIESKIII